MRSGKRSPARSQGESRRRAGRPLKLAATALLLGSLIAGCTPRESPPASPIDLSGVWTHPRTAGIANSTIIIHQEGNLVRMICYWHAFQGPDNVWYGECRLRGGRLRGHYRYTPRTVPPGCGQRGILDLEVSEDGNCLSGKYWSTDGPDGEATEYRRLPQ